MARRKKNQQDMGDAPEMELESQTETSGMSDPEDDEEDARADMVSEVRSDAEVLWDDPPGWDSGPDSDGLDEGDVPLSPEEAGDLDTNSSSDDLDEGDVPFSPDEAGESDPDAGDAAEPDDIENAGNGKKKRKKEKSERKRRGGLFHRKNKNAEAPAAESTDEPEEPGEEPDAPVEQAAVEKPERKRRGGLFGRKDKNEPDPEPVVEMSDEPEIPEEPDDAPVERMMAETSPQERKPRFSPFGRKKKREEPVAAIEQDDEPEPEPDDAGDDGLSDDMTDIAGAMASAGTGRKPKKPKRKPRNDKPERQFTNPVDAVMAMDEPKRQMVFTWGCVTAGICAVLLIVIGTVVTCRMFGTRPSPAIAGNPGNGNYYYDESGKMHVNVHITREPDTQVTVYVLPDGTVTTEKPEDGSMSGVKTVVLYVDSEGNISDKPPEKPDSSKITLYLDENGALSEHQPSTGLWKQVDVTVGPDGVVSVEQGGGDMPVGNSGPLELWVTRDGKILTEDPGDGTASKATVDLNADGTASVKQEPPKTSLYLDEDGNLTAHQPSTGLWKQVDVTVNPDGTISVGHDNGEMSISDLGPLELWVTPDGKILTEDPGDGSVSKATVNLNSDGTASVEQEPPSHGSNASGSYLYKDEAEILAEAEQRRKEGKGWYLDTDRIYTVQRGDTLSYLSGRLGFSVDFLAMYNNIADKNLIITGESLRYPAVE